MLKNFMLGPGGGDAYDPEDDPADYVDISSY